MADCMMLPLSSLKYRLSCDECLLAKVKCDKQKPTCERCLGLGRDCVYSPSRKTGRPPSLAAGKRSSNTNPTLLAPKASSGNLSSSALVDLAAEGPVSANEPNPLSEWDDLDMNALDSLEWLQPWSAPCDAEQSTILAQIETTVPSMDTSPIVFSTFEETAEDCGTSQHSGQCKFGNLTSTMDMSIRGCDHEAFSVLGKLNCTQPIPGEEEGAQASVDSFFQLDNILQRNKSALSTVTQLLDCSCAQHTHLAMLYASIVSKVIAGYQGAARRISTSAILSSSFASRPAFSQLAGPDMARSQVSSTGIRVGSFEPDYVDQAALHRQLLFIEIGKVDAVIDKMLKTFRQHPRPGGEMGRAINWYDLAYLSTKAELQDAKDLVTQGSRSCL